MTEDEIIAKEEELKALEESNNAKAQELEAKAKELQEREETIEASRANTEKLVTDVKQQYEDKFTKQAEVHAKELSERDNIIKELMGGSSKQEQHTTIDKLNAKRALQNKY